VKLVNKVEEISADSGASNTGDYSLETQFLQSVMILDGSSLVAENGNRKVSATIELEATETLRGTSRRIGKAAEILGWNVISPQDATKRNPVEGLNVRRISDPKRKVMHLQVFSVKQGETIVLENEDSDTESE